MKTLIRVNKLSFTLSFIASVLFFNIAQADVVKISNKPLVESSVSDVLPNLMFVLDNSGSMDFNFTPDWVAYNPSTGSTTSYYYGNPNLFNNAVINTQYYNPSIRYSPALDFNGNSLGDKLSPWTSVRNDAFYQSNGNLNQGTSNLVDKANYFSYLPGEFCTTKALTTCTASTVATGIYQFPAPIRWCNSAANANAATPAAGVCQAIRIGSYTNLRTPLATFNITFPSGNNISVSSIKVNGMEIMSGTSANSSNNNSVASRVATVINNNCNTSLSGNCDAVGFSATNPSTNVLTVTSPAGALQNPVAITISSGTVSVSAFTLQRPGSLVYVDIVVGTDSYTDPGSNKKASDRTDCAGTTCKYVEEMTNYANWWTYYRTRMQGMKTSASQAFKTIDNRYRVGFITINSPSSNYLPIAKFEDGNNQQKNNWYTKLFAANPSGGTPLRYALGLVGQIYAGKKPVGSSDPMEYACQPNFTLLTTDGYWNGATGGDVNGTNIGNLDGAGTQPPKYEGLTVASGTLADVSKYYYDTDVRRSNLSNCNGALNQNVCGEGVGSESYLKQNMTTLTLGLGIDGTLFYEDDYETQTTGDFADIRAGNKPWPVPEITANSNATEGPKHIDDLWHAAVNGNGHYFSARNPKELSSSLRRALSDIQSKVGTGSASSASSLQPTSGDNFEYTASYETVKWTGNIESRTVDLLTLNTSESAGWCAEDIAKQSCTAPAQLVKEDINGSTSFYCKTTNTNASNCSSLGGTLTGSECRVGPFEPGCTGKMKDKILAADDTRNIYMNKNGSVIKFEWANLSATQQAYYSTSFLTSNLSQWPDYTSGANSQQTKAVGSNFINYLRGQTGFEDRSSNLVENRLYRYRQATLGDITDSQPAYVRDPRFKYVDSGYDAFITTQKLREPTVYVGANDGMLHAFNAKTGEERWAFVPTPAISKMWKLADKDYATNHINLVNGDAVVGDIYDDADSKWKTILVAGLAGGGRGYYALDITDPVTPKLLWEKTAADSGYSNLGYTFGSPVITKLNDGTWAVLLTSGYNNGTNDSDGITVNSPTGNGGGYLYVLKASSGAPIRTYSTGAGSAATPSGLGQISAYIDDILKNNTTTFVIGGDLSGNVWKFDINTNAAPILLATLVGPSGVAQPISTKPELGIINKNKVAYIGTGKYLEPADLIVVNAPKQTLYAVKVDGSSSLGNLRNDIRMIKQIITGSGESRTISGNNVDLGTDLGWYVDFPEAGERMNVDPLLIGGVIVAPTLVPASTSCSPGGFGYLNFFDYLRGGSLLPGSLISERTNTPIVGIGASYNQDGKAVIKYNTSDNQTSKVSAKSRLLNIGAGTKRPNILRQNDGGTYGRKYMWRELIPNQ